MGETAGTKAVTPYAWLFTLVYTALLLVIVAITFFTNIKPNSGVSIGAAIGAATFAGQRFFADHARVPKGGEVTGLIWWSVLATWVVSVAMFVLPIVMVAEIDDAISSAQVMIAESGLILAGIAVAMTLFYALIYWVSYGPLTRFIASRSKTG